MHKLLTVELPLLSWAAILQEHHADKVSEMLTTMAKSNTDLHVTTLVSAMKLVADSSRTSGSHLANSLQNLTVAVQQVAAATADNTALQHAMYKKLQEVELATKVATLTPDVYKRRERQLAIRAARNDFMANSSNAAKAANTEFNPVQAEAYWLATLRTPALLEPLVAAAIQTITSDMVIAMADESGDAMMSEPDEPDEADEVGRRHAPRNLSASFDAQARAHTTDFPRLVLPSPPKFRGDLDTHITDVKVWLEHIMAYLSEHGKDFCTYLPYYLEGKALEWGRGQITMLRAESRLTAQQLQQDFLLRYDDLLFTPAKKSRDKLYDRSYAQIKGEAYAAYTQRFREIVRDVTDMSHADKIEWFVRGLSPALEAACTTNRGRMWENLDELIEYANGKDIAMRITS